MSNFLKEAGTKRILKLIKDINAKFSNIGDSPTNITDWGNASSENLYNGMVNGYKLQSILGSIKGILKNLLSNSVYKSSILKTLSECTASTNTNDVAGASALSELNDSLKVSTGGITGSYGNISYCKTGNVCTVLIYQQSGTFNSWTYYTLGTLPVGYRPVILVCSGDTRIGNRVKASGYIIIKTDGTIQIVFATDQTVLEDVSLTFVCS